MKIANMEVQKKTMVSLQPQPSCYYFNYIIITNNT